MLVEQRVIEQLPRRAFEQRPRRGTVLGKRTVQVERTAHLGGRFVRRDGTSWHRSQQVGHLVDERVRVRPERIRIHGQ